MEHHWDPDDAAALLQAGMTPAHLRTVLGNVADLGTYLALSDKSLAALGVERITPKYVAVDGVTTVVLGSEAYPERLAGISSPPPVLWVRGNQAALRPGLAVIGTRRISEIGESIAKAAVGAAAVAGTTVISGLATGCDRAAHEAALDAGIPTVAVLACGLDTVYPAAHDELAGRIIEHGGAIVSETPIGEPVSPGRLHSRNRIIIGLAHSVIPCEADSTSGGTIGAIKHAVHEGRMVIVAEVKPRWRAHRGTWLAKTLAAPNPDFSALGISAQAASRIASGSIANGVASTRTELESMVLIASVFGADTPVAGQPS
jgi:DNA protecting protein DprA